VTNVLFNNVSVIATASNTVTATVGVGNSPVGVGIIPPPQGVPFAAFKAALDIALNNLAPNTDSFELLAEFILGSASSGINPRAEPVTLTVGTFTTTIPPGSFVPGPFGNFNFVGTVNGVTLQGGIAPTGAKRYDFGAAAQKANLTGTVNPVPVTLTIGNNAGITWVNAHIH
jgi:YVTN family beta-propeller protein